MMKLQILTSSARWGDVQNRNCYRLFLREIYICRQRTCPVPGPTLRENEIWLRPTYMQKPFLLEPIHTFHLKRCQGNAKTQIHRLILGRGGFGLFGLDFYEIVVPAAGWWGASTRRRPAIWF